MRKLKTPPTDDVLARERAALKRARDLFPTLIAFAAAVGVAHQSVQRWEKTDRIPHRYVARIARLTGFQVRCDELREDWQELVKGW